MGYADRAIRVLLAATILGFFMNGILVSPWTYILGAVAVIFFLTSMVGTCPLYTLIGVKTCRTESN